MISSSSPEVQASIDMSPFRGLDVDALKMLYQDENPFLMESGKPSAASAAIESTDGSQWGDECSLPEDSHDAEVGEDLIDRMRESSPGFLSAGRGDAEPHYEEAASSKVAWLTAADTPAGFIVVAKEELEEMSANFEMRWTAPIATSGLPLVVSDGDHVGDLQEVHLPFQSDKVADVVNRVVQQELRRKRKAPDRFVACGGESQKNATCKRSRKVVAANNKVLQPGKNPGIRHKSKTATSSKPPFKQHADQSTFEGLLAQEEAVVGVYLSKGIKVTLDEQVSVINKKIDILLPQKCGFTRSKFFAAMKPLVKGKRKNLENHVIQIDRIRTNGEGTGSSTSNIFGKPLALHITVAERLGVALHEKFVLRCYKESAEASGKQSSDVKEAYLIQVNAGGMWKCEDSLNLLLADIFSFAGFPVSSADIRARPESCVYSVTNRETWRSVTSNQAVPVNISKLTTKLQHMGFEEVKPLNVTGGMSFQLDEPRCKPQIQKTGTIYMPFCAEPRRVRLAILNLFLPFADEVLRFDAKSMGRNDKKASKRRGRKTAST